MNSRCNQKLFPAVQRYFALSLKMSVTCRLPQFQNHFIPPLPSFLDPSPPPIHYNPPASTSTTFIDGFQGLSTNDRNRRTNTLSPSLTSTENRVSKAKKGKRVHACEYPECTKVRRHQPRLSIPWFSNLNRSLHGLSTGDGMN